MFTIFCERIGRRQAYFLRFSYNEGLITKVKELPQENRKWNAANMAWEVTTASLLSLIKSYKGSTKIHFDFGNEDSRKIFISQIKKIEADEAEKKRLISELNANKERWIKYKEELEQNSEKYSEQVHKYLKPNITLYPYQIVSIMFLNEVRNVLLALDMGLGKTISSIAYAEMNNFEKVFVITPNSLKYNFFDEVLKFTHSKAYIVGKKNDCTIEEAKYVITNYEYFNSSDPKKADAKFKKLNIDKIDCLICDECHRIKETKTSTYINFKRIFKDSIFRDDKVSKIFMSGTPAPSHVYDLYSVLHQISPLDFPTKNFFYEYYCGMSYNLDGYGWESDNNLTKYEELFHKISPYMYRKKKRDVLKDLPEKTYQNIYIDLSPKEMELYNQIEEGVANEFCDKDIKFQISIMGKLREYTSHLKIKYIEELIETILECGEKFVVEDFYKYSLYELHKKYPEISGLHTGDQTDDERNIIKKDFQDENGKIKLFLGSEGTIKEGLTLVAASKVGLLTVPWNPGLIDQIVDRLCRIGQKNAVNAYIFICKNTIDQYAYDLIESKRGELSQVIDNEKYESDVTQSIINELVKIIKEKHKK
jgi:SWI/SNF-related matrix-associated actin-dependent regulator 1 of chromatin subfamily A